MMYRKLLFVFTIVVLIHGGRSGLNPFQIYALKFTEYAAKYLPASIIHDLMGNPFDSLNKIINDENIKSCTKHILNYIKNPQSPKVPKCVHRKDLDALKSAFEATKRMPGEVGNECKDVLTGNLDVLKKCVDATSGKADNILDTVTKAFQNINTSCGQYIRDNKDKILRYYKNGCKGDFHPK